VLAMLVYHPLDLYNPGFQLSFGTVLGLILFTRPMLRGLRRDPDALPFPAARQKPSLWATATSSSATSRRAASPPIFTARPDRESRPPTWRGTAMR